MPLKKQIFSGKYMLINYCITDVSNMGYSNRNNYLYLEDTETGKGYNLTDFIFDDIYNTGSCLMPVGLNNYEDRCYFIKEKDEVDKADNNIKTSNGAVIFIVKTK